MGTGTGSGAFARAGALADTYAEVDWASSPVGAPDTWSPTLRQALDLVWHTRYPATLFWGPQFVLLYNEAYVHLIGHKHPNALGRPTQEVFPEAWDIVGPLMADVVENGGATYVEDQLIPLDRAGFLEECYFTFSYSPVHGPQGRVEGGIDIGSETTPQVVARRRLEALSRLQAVLGSADHEDDVAAVLSGVANAGHPDLPFLQYRTSATSVPVASTGDESRLPARPHARLTGDAPLVEAHGPRTVAWLPLGVWAPEQEGAVLVVELNDRLAPTPDYVTFLELVASAVSQALVRIDLLEAERRTAMTERDFSEALQHSALTVPVQQDDLRVAVRYRPAADTVQIGGDWYDSFVVRDGALTLTVGDVSGHDRASAASMAQVRNILRGIAFTLQEPPGVVMTALDEAMDGLGLGTTATAVLARVEQDAVQVPLGARTLCWTNAGHPPPVLLSADGSVRMLTTRPDLMLGVNPRTVRDDHEVEVARGSSLVFYTDGLVERRGMPLQAGLDWLDRTLRGCGHLGAEELADHVMSEVAPAVEDDVVLMVLRVGG